LTNSLCQAIIVAAAVAVSVTEDLIHRRYVSKKSFIEDIENEHHTLLKLLRGVDDRDFLIGNVCGKWSLKDILAHLHEWHKLALGWYKTGLRNEIPEMPKHGYRWNQIRELNEEFYLKNKDELLARIRSRFSKSHKEIMNLIKMLPEEKILKPGFFPWTTKYPLTTYLHPNASGHYRWAQKHIKRWLRKRKSGLSWIAAT